MGDVVRLDDHRARRRQGPATDRAGGYDAAEVARRCASGERLLTTAGLCRELGVSDREVRRWRTAEPSVPHVPVTARTVRYFLADVLDWQQRRVAA
jgi:hypothetical protein